MFEMLHLLLLEIGRNPKVLTWKSITYGRHRDNEFRHFLTVFFPFM